MFITVPGANNTPVTISATTTDVSNLAFQIGTILSTIQGAGNLAVQTMSLPGGQSSVGVGVEGDIARLYAGILNRAPDAGGLQVWTNLVNNNSIGLSDVADGMLASAEYAQNFGSMSDTMFVNQIYENMFSRPADPAGLEYWVNALANGADRGVIAATIAESNEALTGFDVTSGDNNNAEIYRFYETAFGRAPDAGGEAFWTSMMKSGATVEQVVAAIAQSPEFLADAANGNQAFITALYQNGLHRAVDPDGLAFWLSQIQAGLSLANVALSISDSPEERGLTTDPTSELALNGPGGINLTVPGTYSYVLDNDTAADTLTASNAAIVTNTVGGTFFLSGNSTLAATGGNATVSATGTYDLSFGAGNNLINATGTGAISTGPDGASTVNSSGSNNVINLNGTGDVVTFLGGQQGATVFGGSSGSTIFGSANTDVTYSGPGNFTYSATGGNVTLNAAAATGNANVSLTGAAMVNTGSGADTINIGAGSETLHGVGSNQYNFVSGQTAGAIDYITDSAQRLLNNDTFTFTNYVSNNPNFSSTNGSATLTLADNTKIVFSNLSATQPNETALENRFTVTPT